MSDDSGFWAFIFLIVFICIVVALMSRSTNYAFMESHCVDKGGLELHNDPYFDRGSSLGVKCFDSEPELCRVVKDGPFYSDPDSWGRTKLMYETVLVCRPVY